MRYMSQPLSLRLPDATVERLGKHAKRRHIAPRTLAQRYVEEGLRMDEHPLVRFVDGPAGRRARMLGTSLDMWELISVVRDNDGDVRAAARIHGFGSHHVAWLDSLQYLVRVREGAIVSGRDDGVRLGGQEGRQSTRRGEQRGRQERPGEESVAVAQPDAPEAEARQQRERGMSQECRQHQPWPRQLGQVPEQGVADAPEVAVACLIEHAGQGGGAAAAPVVREVLDAYFTLTHGEERGNHAVRQEAHLAF